MVTGLADAGHSVDALLKGPGICKVGKSCIKRCHDLPALAAAQRIIFAHICWLDAESKDVMHQVQKAGND